jgi:hypothetical protein
LQALAISAVSHRTPLYACQQLFSPQVDKKTGISLIPEALFVLQK